MIPWGAERAAIEDDPRAKGTVRAECAMMLQARKRTRPGAWRNTWPWRVRALAGGLLPVRRFLSPPPPKEGASQDARP